MTLKKKNRIGEKRMMNCGMIAEIIEYRGVHDIDIMLEDGRILKHKAYHNFLKGSLGKLNKIGEIRLMNNGQYAEIIEYRSSEDIDVKFDDGTIAYNKRYPAFKKGNIKNRSKKNYFGEGYIGNTSIQENGITKRSYCVWKAMINRCYNPKYYCYNNYGAKGVKVSECFKCYEYFERWYNRNYYEIEGESVELDKDIFSGCLYSPTTCIFVPSKINLLFRGYSKDTDLPTGVHWSKQNKKYIATIGIDWECIYLGQYDTIEEAEQSYNKKKLDIIKKTIKLYKNIIPLDVYNKIINK